MANNIKPEWKIYCISDAQFSMGQAITWHKALSNLIKSQGITVFSVRCHSGVVFVNSEQGNFKIIKER